MSNLAYLAGFFDGEGCIGIYPNGRGLLHLRTQLSQNVGKHSLHLAELLVAGFGGHYSIQKTQSGRDKFNWQLSSFPALQFLTQVEPFLIVKKEQASLAIAWQYQRPLPSRNERGQMRPYNVDREFDGVAALLMKTLKHADLATAVAQDRKFAEIVDKLDLVPAIPSGFFLKEPVTPYGAATAHSQSASPSC